jgi:hypothetical protein
MAEQQTHREARREADSKATNSGSVFIGLIIVVAMCVGAWFFSPKGENQT